MRVIAPLLAYIIYFSWDGMRVIALLLANMVCILFLRWNEDNSTSTG